MVVEEVAPSSRGGGDLLYRETAHHRSSPRFPCGPGYRGPPESPINSVWWPRVRIQPALRPELAAQGPTDKGLSSTRASRTESPVGSTASPVRCSPTKQASGFGRPPATLLQEEGRARHRDALEPPRPSTSHIPAPSDGRGRPWSAALLGSCWPGMRRPRRLLLEGSATAQAFLRPDRGPSLRDHCWTPSPGGSQSLGPPPPTGMPRPTARVRFPSPTRRGFRRAGPRVSGCEEGARPCGTSPAPPRVQPDFLRRRAPGTSSLSPRDRPQSVCS